MGRLDRYILLELAAVTLGLTLVLTFTIWVMRSLRLIELMLASGAPFAILLQALALALPSALGIIAPAALGIAVAFCYYRLLSDSEIVVMRSAGRSAWQLSRPALLLGTLMTIAVLGLNLFASPAARVALLGLRGHLRDITLLLRENTFTELTDGLTVYATRRYPSGAMSGIVIHDQREPDKEVILVAERGAVIRQGDSFKLILEGGVRQQRENDTGLSELSFQRYEAELPFAKLDLKNRFRRTWELSLSELLDPPPQVIASAERLRHYQAELHMRVASPLLAVTFVFTALACLLTQRGSRNGYHWPALGAVGVIALLQGIGFGLSHLAFDDLIFAGGLYVLHLLVIPLAGWKISKC